MSEPTTQDRQAKKSVVVLFNHVGDDPYEVLRDIDPDTLDFKPEYPIDVATISEEYKDMVTALRQAGYRARAVNLNNDLRKLERVLRRNPPDVIFNLVEFFHEDSSLEAAVAGMYDLYRIAYTGSPPFTLALCQDKVLAKRTLQDHGVRTPRFKVLYEPVLPKRLGLRFPVIVKPAWEDASAGVGKDSVLYDPEGLSDRVDLVYREYGATLIEEFVEGRELHVGVWGNDQPEMLPPLEFDFADLPSDHPPLISYAMKWNPLEEVYHQVHTICPAPLSRQLYRKVEKTAIAAYEATECRDYARIDMRIKKGEPFVLEVNPNPDLTEGVSFMDSAEQAGITFEQALVRIVELAAERRTPPKPTTSPAPTLNEDVLTAGDDGMPAELQPSE